MAINSDWHDNVHGSICGCFVLQVVFINNFVRDITQRHSCVLRLGQRCHEINKKNEMSIVINRAPFAETTLLKNSFGTSISAVGVATSPG